ncbi:TPA: hypothetical protein O6E10_001007 [Vibrio cholerae]|nr:hypothetical protein [Vibrio cholerae]
MNKILLGLSLIPLQSFSADWKFELTEDVFSGQTVAQAHLTPVSKSNESRAELTFFCTTTTQQNVFKDPIESVTFKTIALKLTDTDFNFSKNDEIELSIKLGNNEIVTGQMKANNSTTVNLGSGYKLFDNVASSDRLAIKLKTWTYENAWVFNVSGLKDLKPRFNEYCSEKEYLNFQNELKASAKAFSK